MEEFAEKLQTIAANLQRNDHLNHPMKDNDISGGERTIRIGPKHQIFTSQEDIPNELRDDFLYLEVSSIFVNRPYRSKSLTFASSFSA